MLTTQTRYFLNALASKRFQTKFGGYPFEGEPNFFETFALKQGKNNYKYEW